MPQQNGKAGQEEDLAAPAYRYFRGAAPATYNISMATAVQQHSCQPCRTHRFSSAAAAVRVFVVMYETTGVQYE